MTKSSFDLNRIGGAAGLSALKDEIVAAGDAAMAYFRNGVAVAKKSDNSPVTQADHEVEARLQKFLRARYPKAAFFGEETGEHAGAGDPGLRFVVDPIDGTRAFVRGLPTWSVLVGVEAEGVPVVGVAYMPAIQECFVGVQGGGATCNGKPLRVSTVKSLDAALVSHGAIEQFLGTGLEDSLLALGKAAYTTRGFADFEGYRQVLLGRADAMVDPGVQPYDVCAAAVLIKEAGGRFSSIDGQDSVYGGSGLATNGLVHDELLAILR